MRPTPTAIETIVWDLDDVLNDLTRIWFESAWMTERPDCRLGYHELVENPPHRLLGITRDEYLQSLDRFRGSPEAEAMAPEQDLLRWFSRYGNRYRHVALTARPRESAGSGMKWLWAHFGEWIQTLAFVPSERPGQCSRQPDRSKADYLAWLGKADYFIDDNAENCRAAAQLGICTFMVAKPWNTSRLAIEDILKRLGDVHPAAEESTGRKMSWRTKS